MSLSCFGRVALGEIPERLAGVAPRREIAAEHPLDDGGGVVRLHVAIDLAADVLIGAVAAAEEEVVAFHHVIVVVDRDLGAEQADVADVVLAHEFGQPVTWMLSGTSSSSLASRWSAMARACRFVSEEENLQPKFPVQATRPVRTSVAFQARPRASISRWTASTRSSRDVRDQQVLPDGQPDRPAAVAVGDRGQARASGRTTSVPTGSTTPT